MPLKFVTVNDGPSASGGLRPPDPATGAPPLNCAGDFCPQILSVVQF